MTDEGDDISFGDSYDPDEAAVVHFTRSSEKKRLALSGGTASGRSSIGRLRGGYKTKSAVSDGVEEHEGEDNVLEALLSLRSPTAQH